MEVEAWKRKLQNWLAERAGFTRCPDLDDRKECPHPDCNRVMLYRDIYEHFFATHIFPQYPYQVDGKQGKTDTHMSHGDDFSVSDYVDDYEVDWIEEEEDELNIQEAKGGQSLRVKRERLRKKWKPYLKELKSEREVHIGKNEKPLGKHGPRGSDAAQKLKSAVERLDLDFDVRIKHQSQGAIIKVKR